MGFDLILYNGYREILPCRKSLEESEREWNDNRKTDFSIHLSMGTALGNYENESELRKILEEADKNMYQVKSMRKS